MLGASAGRAMALLDDGLRSTVIRFREAYGGAITPT